MADHSPGGARNIAETFRRLYYRLYSNSSTSRAERLVENLATILLLKFSMDKLDADEPLKQFMAGQTTAASLLQEFLPTQLPARAVAGFSFSISDESVREAMSELAHLDLSIAPAHILGEAFQALIGPRLRGDKGQFFTPKSLVRAMVRVLDPQPNESVLDPACGTGGFLGEVHVHQQELTGKQTGRLVGIEKDPDLARLATALLHVGTGGRGELLNANSLDPSEVTPAGLANDFRFDVVLTNPPFGSRIPIQDRSILKNYELAHAWIFRGESAWTMTPAVVSAQDPQILFVELCVKLLRPGGRMGIVLPEGVFGNKQQGYVWTWLRQQGRITALLDCPRTTFQPSTDTKTNVLFFEKADASSGVAANGNGKVSVGVALRCGHDRRGRTHMPDGKPHDDDFERLGKAFGTNGSRNPWKKVALGESNYLVPRYYVRNDSFAEAEEDIIRGARLATIGELIDDGVLTVRKGHEVGSHAYGSGDIPFVRTSDVNNLEISTDPTNAVSDEVFEEYRRQQDLKPGDVLMVVDGRYRIGATAILSENNHRCVVQSHFRIISLRQHDKLTPYELLYALNLPSVRIRIRDLVFVQSTLGTLGARLLELEIPLLHGRGPWRERVDRFEDVLRKRDALLMQIKEMSGPEVEL
ncbi:MAG TPA: N-6 DNA methylase [Gammaproteobacteria bacterium]|nr:N-6 DNA methylase [Gammaproteobacteria bacterium]